MEMGMCQRDNNPIKEQKQQLKATNGSSTQPENHVWRNFLIVLSLGVVYDD